jgi:hypothetical protein
MQKEFEALPRFVRPGGLFSELRGSECPFQSTLTDFTRFRGRSGLKSFMTAM